MIDLSIKSKQVYTGTALVSGGTQGGLYYNGNIYQFGDGGYCQILDANTLAKGASFRLPAYADNSSYPHCSSVEWIVPGQKVAVTTCATGLAAYADRFYIYDISDTDNITQEIVMMSGCTDRSKYARMACMAYDQDSEIMYVAGYTSGSGKDATSPCWFEKYDFSDYINSGVTAATKIMQTESDGPGMHLQDGNFYKGYIYYLCDRDDTTNSAYNGLYFWVMDTDFKTICVADILPDCPYEAETFALIPGEHYITLVSSIYKNGITYQKTRIGIPEVEPALTLHTSVNVLGYRVNGTLYGEDAVFNPGTYTIVPVLKDETVWNSWSDDETTQTRTITATTQNPIELTAYAVQETVYLVGSPAPKSQSTRGTSVNAQGAYADLYFIVSTNTTYPNEYMLVSDGKQNDGDQDITVLGSAKMGNNESQYFSENNITAEEYYWTSIPKGYTRFKVSINAGIGEDNTPGARNPHVIITTGPTAVRQKKIYGNTDVYRPLSASVITEEGFIFDLSALKLKDGSTNAYTMEEYSYIFVRIGGNASRLNNSYATITFMKDEQYTILDSVTQNGYTGFITDYVPNANTELEYTIKYGSDSLSYSWGGHFLSSSDSNGSNSWYSPLFRTKGLTDGSIEVFSILGNATESTHTFASYDISNPYKFEVKDGHIYVNETSVVDVTPGNNTTQPLAMFSINKGGALVTNDYQMKNVTFYGCTIKENGTVVRNYAPALENTSNTYGVLETTTNTFYAGNNSGFIA